MRLGAHWFNIRTLLVYSSVVNVRNSILRLFGGYVEPCSAVCRLLICQTLGLTCHQIYTIPATS